MSERQRNSGLGTLIRYLEPYRSAYLAALVVLAITLTTERLALGLIFRDLTNEQGYRIELFSAP
ncbi:MAG: hypothetical protein AB1331_06950 [Bacillota bacterium]